MPSRSGPLRIVVHDYSGHPGQVHLSRELARRGHAVTHQYSPTYPTGRGAVERLPDDPTNLRIVPVPLRHAFARYRFVTRLQQEVEYAARAARAILREHPDVVLLSNIPLLSHFLVSRALRARKVPTVMWQQDVYSAGVEAAARQRWRPRTATVAGTLAGHLERSVARSSEHVIAISEQFCQVLDDWKVPRSRRTVIPNWAPVDEIPIRPRRNPWAVEAGLADVRTVLYAGTLGVKHDTELLVELARRLGRLPDVRLVVVSEGLGRGRLHQAQREERLDALVSYDYQPYDVLPDVLASADVALAILQPAAATYSVPSKVLTYLAAGRPIVAAISSENAAATVLRESGAGVVCDPQDGDALCEAVEQLLDDPDRRATMGSAGREYAESRFRVETVADQFETILVAAAEGPAPAPATDREAVTCSNTQA